MVPRPLAHNAEHWLATHLNAYLRDDDEYRAVTRGKLPTWGPPWIITFTPCDDHRHPRTPRPAPRKTGPGDAP